MAKKLPKPVCVDFETGAIRQRPRYPPVPVGVSIQWPGKAPRYYGFGHPEGNNCAYSEALAELEKAWAHPDGILCQNGKFDLDVAEVHCGLPLPTWDRTHETMFLLFLDNPHSYNFGLKESSKEMLGIEPEERDIVADWLLKNQPIPDIKIGAGKNSKHPAGAYIMFAPGGIVGDYANGDTKRTSALFKYLYPSVCHERGMAAAYDRERKLMPILLASERGGVRVNVSRLRDDIKTYHHWLAVIDRWLRDKFGNQELNIDSGPQLAEALISSGLGDASLMGLTAKGNIATNKKALAAGVTDPVMAAVLQYRAQLSTCVGTFLEPWLIMAEASGGYIFTTWHQVKAVNGTRTGRLSSTPNFQNMPKEFAALFAHEAEREEDPGRKAKLLKVKSPWGDKLPPLPLCRGYIIPYQDGHVLVGRDYSQQEPRILGHFENGPLMAQYQANVWIDYHDNAKDHLERIMGRKYARKPVKNINLGIIYGQGVPSLAEKNNSSVQETQDIKNAIYKLYPGLKDMYDDMRMRSRNNIPIITWGGRVVYCEKPRFIKGRMMNFDYKMVNYLIQGSAADATKEAMIRFIRDYIARMHNRGWKLILQVHDEIVLSVPAEDAEEAQECLRLSMESLEFDVPLLSEGAYSNDNWSVMKDFDKKGKRVN